MYKRQSKEKKKIEKYKQEQNEIKEMGHQNVFQRTNQNT